MLERPGAVAPAAHLGRVGAPAAQALLGCLLCCANSWPCKPAGCGHSCVSGCACCAGHAGAQRACTTHGCAPPVRGCAPGRWFAAGSCASPPRLLARCCSSRASSTARSCAASHKQLIRLLRQANSVSLSGWLWAHQLIKRIIHLPFVSCEHACKCCAKVLRTGDAHRPAAKIT